MTEAEWLAQRDPKPLLKYLRRRWPRRKVRLFVSEALWPLFERFFRPDELAALPSEFDLWAEGRERSRQPTPVLDTGLSLLAEVTGFPIDLARLFWDPDWLDAHRLVDRAELSDRRHYAAVLHDLAGNPFRPAEFDPSWRTDDAVALARQMYDSRDFAAMPILADALQDAGCDSADILGHCRDVRQPHVRGCWVVDLVLRK
jgi:hypothetical protein